VECQLSWRTSSFNYAARECLSGGGKRVYICIIRISGNGVARTSELIKAGSTRERRRSIIMCECARHIKMQSRAQSDTNRQRRCSAKVIS